MLGKRTLLKIYGAWVVLGLLALVGIASYDFMNPDTRYAIKFNNHIEEINVGLRQSNECNLECGLHGICRNDRSNQICLCDKNWIDNEGTTCSYEQKPKLVAFLLSIFVGEWGVDWFYLAKGNPGYIVAGVFKLLTGGGLGIWWLVDWIRILADTFKDGNHMPLGDW
ncbi:TM2 domain protein [uncultured virus]|nr:TM2 domain protein [uncultured virus]